MYISRDKFNAYEEVRFSGATNMFDLDEVLRLNKKMSEIELTKKELHYIMKNYSKLCKRFGYVRVQGSDLKGEGKSKEFRSNPGFL